MVVGGRRRTWEWLLQGAKYVYVRCSGLVGLCSSCPLYRPCETPEAAVLVGDAEDGLLAAVASCSAHVLRPSFLPIIARPPGGASSTCIFVLLGKNISRQTATRIHALKA